MFRIELIVFCSISSVVNFLAMIQKFIVNIFLVSAHQLLYLQLQFQRVSVCLSVFSKFRMSLEKYKKEEFISSGDTKRRIIPSIVVLIIMFILQVLFAVFDARDCKKKIRKINSMFCFCLISASGVFLCVTILNIVVIGGWKIFIDFILKEKH